MNSGIEHAALMVSEEKTQHDSRKNPKHAYVPTPSTPQFQSESESVSESEPES